LWKVRATKNRSARICRGRQLEMAGCSTIAGEESRGLLPVRRIL